MPGGGAGQRSARVPLPAASRFVARDGLGVCLCVDCGAGAYSSVEWTLASLSQHPPALRRSIHKRDSLMKSLIRNALSRFQDKSSLVLPWHQAPF